MFCGCVFLFQCISLLFFFFSLSRQTSASPSLSRTRKRCFSHLLCRYWFKNFFKCLFLFCLPQIRASTVELRATFAGKFLFFFCDLHPLLHNFTYLFVLFVRFRRRSIGCENVVHRDTSRTQDRPVRCTFLLTQFLKSIRIAVNWTNLGMGGARFKWTFLCDVFDVVVNEYHQFTTIGLILLAF